MIVMQATIISFRSNKILFFGIRNRYCCICEKAHALKLSTKDNKCFLNWDKAATGIEADGISEEFARSIELHGLKFNRLIGNFIKYNLNFKYNRNTYDSIINNRNIKKNIKLSQEMAIAAY